MIEKSAEISKCGRYRYLLSRNWDFDRPACIFIGLNPSTADADVDDPTIRRCVGFARRLGMGGIAMYNLYAWRDTSPKALFAAKANGQDIVGPYNDFFLRLNIHSDSCVIAAWGANAPEDRVRDVRRLLGGMRFMALATNKDGSPKHPLYIRADSTPKPWRPQ